MRQGSWQCSIRSPSREDVIAAESASRVAAIQRAGSLRLALFPSFFYRKDPFTGELRGVGVEIARGLGLHVGVGLKITEYPSPPEVVAALAAAAADVALLGIDPARATEVDFSPPLLAADFTYLVGADSAVRAVTDADRPGVRIALVRHHAMDTVLRGRLVRAERVYADTPDAAFDLFRTGGADVLAGIRPGLLMYARLLPGARVLDDRYGRNVIALAVKKGDAELLSCVADFVRKARADGAVARAIASAGLQGVEAAPA